MSDSLQNILILLGVLLVAGVGWYMYSEGQRVALDIESEGNLQAEIQSFIQTQQTLRRIELDAAILDDPAFTSLQTVTNPVPIQGSGRANPFAPAN